MARFYMVFSGIYDEMQCNYTEREQARMDIKKHIPYGRENAVNLGTLCDRLGLGQTAIKQAIREERKKGTAILSGREGYWISTDPEEIKQFNDVMRGQALARFATIKGIKTGAKDG